MQIKLEWTITAILAVSAILSPILTALINNMHQSKIRKLDMKHEKYMETVAYKRKLIESYLQKTACCVQYHTAEHRERYAESFGLVVSYVPNEVKDALIKIDKLINQNETDKAYSEFIQLIPTLTNIVQQL